MPTFTNTTYVASHPISEKLEYVSTGAVVLLPAPSTTVLQTFAATEFVNIELPPGYRVRVTAAQFASVDPNPPRSL